MPAKINLNTAQPKQLTQLPGIAKNLAYRITAHRKRHGYFTHWDELLEVREFPPDALEALRARATLEVPGIPKGDFGPRRLKPGHVESEGKRPKGNTGAVHSTRNSDRMKSSG
jgi:hypothetical protein